jgi:hypothetical protein
MELTLGLTDLAALPSLPTRPGNVRAILRLCRIYWNNRFFPPKT